MATNPYIVRLAEQDDLLVLARLVELVPDLTAEELSPVQRATWDRMMATEDLTIYLAEFDGEPVGYTASLQMPHLTYLCRPTVFVESMHVLEGHRRRGVARRMLARLLADAQAAGCHKVQLLTHKRRAQDGAHDLYRSQGGSPPKQKGSGSTSSNHTAGPYRGADGPEVDRPRTRRHIRVGRCGESAGVPRC